MALLLILAPILLCTLLSVAGWLIKRNEDQHKELGDKIEKIGNDVVSASSKLDILLQDRRDLRSRRKWLT